MKSKSTKLKLTIELVPGASWYKNLHAILSQPEWKKVREKALAKYKNKCGICGAKGRLNCHELWDYDEKKYIQKLTGFMTLCGMCHLVKHLGLAGILVSEGKLDMDEVIKHFMRVNNCNRKIFEEHKKKAFGEWRKRSEYGWQIDFGKYKKLICGKNKQLQKKIENAENEWKPKTIIKTLKTRLNCPECKQGHLIIRGWKGKSDDRSIRIKGRLIRRKREIYHFFDCQCDRYPVCRRRCGCAFISGCGDMSIATSMIRYKKRLVKLLDKLKI